MLLKISSDLVEQASHRIAVHSPGNRVASMMLLAARIEDLSEEISKS